MPLLLLVVAMTHSVFAGTPEGGLPVVPRQGVLVLRGGQVLQGKIRRAGDVYHVVLPGGEIRLRASSVTYQCETLEQAYCRRRETIRVGNADEHIKLARWCERNGLLSAAARELADAMAADPENRLIPHMERRLKATLAPVPPRVNAPEIVRRKGPTREELDRMVCRMPSGSVETFTSSIQPLLINNCTTGGCHGPRSAGALRLFRGRPGGPPSRRVTQQNLHATLGCIDREQPDASPLLTEAIRAHETAEVPALTEADSEKYRRIVQWVHDVAGAGSSGGSSAKSIGTDRLVASRVGRVQQSANPRAPSPEGTSAAAAKDPWSRSPFDRPPTPDVSGAQRVRSTARRGAEIERFVPADPFDPEIFNRRYHRGGGPVLQR